MSKEGPSSMQLERLRMLWNFQNDITLKGAFDTVSRDFCFVHCLHLVLDHHLYNGSIRFKITSRVVSLIMVFLPSPSQLKEVLDKETLFPLFCLLWF